MKGNDVPERMTADVAAKRSIPRCGSCGQKVWKRDREVFERIGMCLQCALRELNPLANSLDEALCGDPETLVMAMDDGRPSYHDALLDLALRPYEAGWRLAGEVGKDARQSLSPELRS